MTILTVCQNASDYIGLTEITSVIGQNTRDARRLRSSVRWVLDDLVTRKFPDLLRTGTITTVDSENLYDEPSDLYAYVSDTFWTSNQRFAAGPMNPQLFERLLQNGTVTVDPIHRLKQTDEASNFRRQFEIYPVPADVYTVSFLYWSDSPLQDTAQTSRLSEWTSDDDEGIIDEYLIELGVIYRMLVSMRRNYAEEMNDYISKREQRMADAKTGRLIDIRHTLARPLANTPEVGFGT